MKKGDLAYIPSEVTLRQFDRGKRKQTPYLRRYFKTEVPASVVVLGTGESSGNYQVLFRGETWMVEKKNLYPITRSSQNGDSEVDRSI